MAHRIITIALIELVNGISEIGLLMPISGSKKFMPKPTNITINMLSPTLKSKISRFSNLFNFKTFRIKTPGTKNR
jgi:DNA polymerase III epsilon subunit-like protein